MADFNSFSFNPASFIKLEVLSPALNNPNNKCSMETYSSLYSAKKEAAFATYSQNPVDRASTIAARILSNDPSALAPTPEQTQYVQQLRKFMGVK
jgi:hypothetical protein